MIRSRIAAALLLATGTAVHAGAPVALQSDYPFAAASTEQGARLWTGPHEIEGGRRNCSTCHTDNLRRPGRHAISGKSIEPLAPAANPKRLTDPKQVAKWLGRNCRWTWGRECTPSEQAALLLYINEQ
jgi:hypothetical protein